MGETLARRVTLREAQDAADVLRDAAEEAMREATRGFPTHWHYAERARAEALRRVAEWIEQEAMRDG